MSEETLTLTREDRHQIAVRRRRGDSPGVMFLGGFLSDMTGTKATHLVDWAAETGRAFTRFDYFAHGASSGDWEDATISRWRQDALTVLDEATDGAQILVGSSMGGWMALLAAMARPERVKALVLIAPAADFTESADMGVLPAACARSDRAGREMDGAQRLWSALRRHQAPDRGRAEMVDPQRPDPGLLPGAHPSGLRRPRRTLDPCRAHA